MTDVNELLEQVRREEQFELATVALQAEQKAKRSKCGGLKTDTNHENPQKT